MQLVPFSNLVNEFNFRGIGELPCGPGMNPGGINPLTPVIIDL